MNVFESRHLKGDFKLNGHLNMDFKFNDFHFSVKV